MSQSMRNKLERKYCTNCKDFKVFAVGGFYDLTTGKNTMGFYCLDCNSLFDRNYKLQDISIDKINQQRERFIKLRNKKFKFMIELGLGAAIINDKLFNMSNNEIEEDDAGLINEENIIKQKVKEEQKQKAELIEKFGNQERNSLCSCGSGLKFKKCHLLKIR